MQPLVAILTAKAKEMSPAKQETAAFKELQAVQKKLKETEAKLRLSQQSASSQPSNSSPNHHVVTPGSVETDLIESFEDIPIEEDKTSEKVKPSTYKKAFTSSFFYCLGS